MRLAALCVTAAAALAACSRPAPSETFFPLEAGHRWTYSMTTERGDDTSERETLTLKTMGSETLVTLDGGNAWRRRSESGVDYWLRADASGVYRVASKSDLDAEPVADKTQRWVLKTPLVVGTQWQSATVPYLLRRRNEFPRELKHSHPNVPMTYRIEALGQSVETRAGRFDGCLRVTGSAAVRVFADPASGWRDLPLSTTEWYCPAVGLVKLERKEPAQSAFLEGGSVTLELLSWQ